MGVEGPLIRGDPIGRSRGPLGFNPNSSYYNPALSLWFYNAHVTHSIDFGVLSRFVHKLNDGNDESEAQPANQDDEDAADVLQAELVVAALLGVLGALASSTFLLPPFVFQFSKYRFFLEA